MTERTTQLIIGVWVLISPWLLGFSSISIMKWSNLACGLVLILMNVWLMFGKAAPVPAQTQMKDGSVITKERSSAK